MAEQPIKRWAFDWGNINEVVGKRVDSVQFGAQGAKEQLTIRFQDGIRLHAQAQPDGTMRAWLSCCGKPEGSPPEVKT